MTATTTHRLGKTDVQVTALGFGGATIARVGGTMRTVVPWGTYSAALMVVIIPIMIVFFAFQRWFIRGITMGAIKG